MSQEDLILRWLRQRGSITPVQAMDHLYCMRLAARIHDLKNKGHNIQTEEIPGKPYVRYRLKRG